MATRAWKSRIFVFSGSNRSKSTEKRFVKATANKSVCLLFHKIPIFTKVHSLQISLKFLCKLLTNVKISEGEQTFEKFQKFVLRGKKIGTSKL